MRAGMKHYRPPPFENKVATREKHGKKEKERAGANARVSGRARGRRGESMVVCLRGIKARGIGREINFTPTVAYLPRLAYNVADSFRRERRCIAIGQRQMGSFTASPRPRGEQGGTCLYTRAIATRYALMHVALFPRGAENASPSADVNASDAVEGGRADRSIVF